MQIYYSKYADRKFDILNKHHVFIRKEEIEECLKNPEQIKKKGNYLAAKKDKIKVVFMKQYDINKIITFYPVK